MTFQPPSKSLTPRDYQFITLVAILFLIVSAALVSANLTLKHGGGDFYVHWVASRGFIFEKTDPYSGQIPARVQELVYGDAAKPGNEPYILDTPFHLLLLYFPFSLLSDPQLARAIYTLILELALFALALLSLRLTDWEVPRYFWILFLLYCVFNFYTFQAILSASPVILLGLAYAGILLALKNDQDELAGALTAVSLYYWEVGGLFLLLISWRAYREGRGRFFAGLGMLTIVLAAISFLLYPNWIIPYLRAGMNNLRADFGFSTHEVFRYFFSAQSNLIAWIFIGSLVIALGYEWSTALTADSRKFYWTACLSLAASPLLGFRTEMEHLAILVIPLAFIFSIVQDRWQRIGNGLAIMILLVGFFAPWAVFFLGLPRLGRTAEEILFLFLPLFTVLGLYWIRWWAIRPPRVWADLANRRSQIPNRNS
ncbi:MAG: hypothetical protein IH589_18215 [Anaerolineales bacterium]|nr:hypothetical protein [Anaerolineales bacterium]